VLVRREDGTDDRWGDDLDRVVIPWTDGTSLGTARAAGARAASGRIVAFLLDHSYPDPGWAEALISSYEKRPWAAVGYRFRNANPDGYVSDATFLANYGPWATAPRGEVRLLPGYNVSYRRSDLLALDQELDVLLDADSSVHRRFLDAGLSLGIEPCATVAAECFESIADVCRSNAAYAQVMADRRARLAGWSTRRRIGQALLAPAVATAFRLARIWRGSNDWRSAMRCMPALVAICLSWAFGEAGGFLVGTGRSGRLIHWEPDAIRASG
jgi:glycosyltransferase involved in cell wall biosynthesis